MPEDVDPPSRHDRRPPTSAEGVLMPAFTPTFDASAKGYGLAWLPDGFPGVQVDDEIRPHALLGVYVLADYLEQHLVRPSRRLEEAIRVVGRAAVCRMNTVGEALVFKYPAEPKRFARATAPYISALTQAYYALTLHRAGVVTGAEDLVAAARRVYLGLRVPTGRGGVLRETPFGPALEELPQEPPSLILNGWLSALAWLWKYSQISGAGDARALLDESFAAVLRLLPLYDAPGFATSRYGLSGFVMIRFLLPSRPANALVHDLAIDIPGFEKILVTEVDGPSRWCSYFVGQDVVRTERGLRPHGRAIRANVVLCRSSLTDGNSIELRVGSDRDVDITMQIQLGRFNPRRGAPVDQEWVDVGVRRTTGGGQSLLRWDLGVDATELIAYPTNCIKQIDGVATNVYHGIHIDRLRALGRALENPEAIMWADRWTKCTERWKDMPEYRECRALIPDPDRQSPIRRSDS